MALRCFLVGLVACFGFEIPAPSEVTSWTTSGRTWLAERAGELAAFRVEATGWLAAHDLTSRTPAEPARPERGPTPAAAAEVVAAAPALAPATEAGDEVFEAVTASVVAEFVADNLALAAQDDRPAPEVEGDGPAPAGGPAEANRLVLAEPAPAPASVDPASAVDPGAHEPSPTTTAGRLNSAVRLTHEAVRAWAALARGVEVDASLLR